MLSSEYYGIYMIEGRQGEHFGDSDGNSNIQNPGDGFGIFKNGQQLGYLDGMVGHAILASETSDATENIRTAPGTFKLRNAVAGAGRPPMPTCVRRPSATT